VAVHSVKEPVPNQTRATSLVVHVKPDANVSQDMLETKRVIVSHGASVHHKIHAVPTNIIHTAEVHVKNQNAAVFNHMDMDAMLKDFRSNVLLFAKRDANVFPDIFVTMLSTVTAMENVLKSINVFPTQSPQQDQPPLHQSTQ
jgi:hypothetical protein